MEEHVSEIDDDNCDFQVKCEVCRPNLTFASLIRHTPFTPKGTERGRKTIVISRKLFVSREWRGISTGHIREYMRVREGGTLVKLHEVFEVFS